MRRRRVITFLIIAIMGIMLALYVGFPMVMALVALIPGNDSVGEPPAGFENVTLTATDADDLTLASWYAPPENGAVIILVHGAGGGRESVRTYASMLQKHGFGVLAVSTRGYDESEGQINRMGWSGNHDIGAAVEFLAKQRDVQNVGGLGLSMGGEILLGAASSFPALRAIVADGATHRAVNEYIALPENQPLYRNLTQHVFTFWVGLFSGEAKPDPPLHESIKQAEGTAFLFIAAGNVADEIAYNSLFHVIVGGRSQLWILPDVDHTGGFSATPDAYETQVITFFERELLSDSE